MRGSTVYIQSATAENREEKKKKKNERKKEITAAKYNGLPYWAAIIVTVVRFGRL